MTVLDPQTRKKNRQDALSETKKSMTKAQRVHRQFVAGNPPASEFRTPSEAIRAASVLLQGLKSAMGPTESEDDIRVGIAYVDTSFATATVSRYLSGQEQKLLGQLTGQPIILIGLLFAIVDRERKHNLEQDYHAKEYITVAGMRPFFVTKQVIGLLKEIIEYKGGVN